MAGLPFFIVSFVTKTTTIIRAPDTHTNHCTINNKTHKKNTSGMFQKDTHKDKRKRAKKKKETHRWIKKFWNWFWLVVAMAPFDGWRKDTNTKKKMETITDISRWGGGQHAACVLLMFFYFKLLSIVFVFFGLMLHNFKSGIEFLKIEIEKKKKTFLETWIIGAQNSPFRRVNCWGNSNQTIRNWWWWIGDLRQQSIPP